MDGAKRARKNTDSLKAGDVFVETPVQHAVHHPQSESKTLLYAALAVAAVLLLFNQWQLVQLSQITPGVSRAGSGLVLVSGERITYAPVLLAAGEVPVLPSYGTKIKQLPTVSPSQQKPKTGDIVQDTLNMIVPTGTPEYGSEIGVSFDDPINAQHRLGALEDSIQLGAQEQQRWERIVGRFTCDYCCGSPSRPTIITHCGCAHAGAWRGLAKFLIKKYGDSVTDEQIMGELSKWKAVWYPGPTVQRIIQEQSAGAGSSSPVQLDKLPSMVGGC